MPQLLGLPAVALLAPCLRLSGHVGGIGRAICEGSAMEGAKVAVADLDLNEAGDNDRSDRQGRLRGSARRDQPGFH